MPLGEPMPITIGRAPSGYARDLHSGFITQGKSTAANILPEQYYISVIHVVARWHHHL